jgi:diaphanous 1
MGKQKVRPQLITTQHSTYFSKESSRIPAQSLIFNIIGLPLVSNPFSRSAKRKFRFCIPEEWYRRSKSRSMSSSASAEPSEATIRRLEALQESDEEEEDDGTAKRNEVPQSQVVRQNSTSNWRNSISPNRLSHLFDGWNQPAAPETPTRSSVVILPDKKAVSEPKLVEHGTGMSMTAESTDNSDLGDLEFADFEQMVVRFERLLCSFPFNKFRKE